MKTRTVFNESYLPMLRSCGLAEYEAVMAYSHGEPLVKPGLGRRERIRLELNDPYGRHQTVYLKRYGDCRSAKREWRGIHAVKAAGISTMNPIAVGTGPAGGFVMVSEVGGVALSRRMAELLSRFGNDAAAMTALAEGLGALAAKLHSSGLAHRDFYACHVFIDQSKSKNDPIDRASRQPTECNCSLGLNFQLSLIDLARVFRPRWRKWRWWAKDLGQLKFSMDRAWVDRYWPILQSAYATGRGAKLPGLLALVIDRRVKAMRRRQEREQVK
ncbi:MAG: hypothetical protein HQ546_03325 [Planctomycetes bacterium]|nr:hypothetical protein [Planctomycetota bacterium]